ncbi:MAG TPA: hypothetical protein VGP82_03985, partial [Ktedonobacterales bacterium]|nr:hypothetical protein [Ktedonobacterales bacterium]
LDASEMPMNRVRSVGIQQTAAGMAGITAVVVVASLKLHNVVMQDVPHLIDFAACERRKM